MKVGAVIIDRKVTMPGPEPLESMEKMPRLFATTVMGTGALVWLL